MIPMRAAIYARYSSDHQREASIEDQVRQCRARIEQEGWILSEIYSDAAISGATTLRPGYQSMLEGARKGEIDVIVAEALDRLSRDQENVAGLYKQLSFPAWSRREGPSGPVRRRQRLWLRCRQRDRSIRRAGARQAPHQCG